MHRKIALAVLLLLAAPSVQAAELTVMTSGAFTAALKAMAPAYEKESGNHLIMVFGPSMGTDPTAIPVRLARGEQADLVILARSGLDVLVAKGAVTPPGTDLVRSRIAMAVKAGAPKPDISTLAALRKTLLAAQSVAYSDSASGVYIENELYKKLGIADRMAKKSHKIAATPVGLNVARGEVALGFQQMAELKPVPGITIVGYLPVGAQKETVFSGGLVKTSSHPVEAHALLVWLGAPARGPAIRASGLQPIAGNKSRQGRSQQ